MSDQTALCEVCGAGYYLLSGYCDHCNAIQAGSEPHQLHLKIIDLQSRLTAAEKERDELKTSPPFASGVVSMARNCKSACVLLRNGQWDVAATEHWLDAVISNDASFIEEANKQIKSKMERADVQRIIKWINACDECERTTTEDGCAYCLKTERDAAQARVKELEDSLQFYKAEKDNDRERITALENALREAKVVMEKTTLACCTFPVEISSEDLKQMLVEFSEEIVEPTIQAISDLNISDK